MMGQKPGIRMVASNSWLMEDYSPKYGNNNNNTNNNYNNDNNNNNNSNNDNNSL
jgi:hypothetical protein